jgi:hypothetical protein
MSDPFSNLSPEHIGATHRCQAGIKEASRIDGLRIGLIILFFGYFIERRGCMILSHV